MQHMESKNETLSAEQIHILRHALGIGEDGKGRSYRNRYVCDPSPEIESLVKAGLMVDTGAYSMFGGMHGYQVTDAGIIAAKSKPEPPRKGQAKD